jgi:diamine N-acetyltransferase
MVPAPDEERVSLRPIGPEDEAACIGLRVGEGQEGLVAPNAASLEWARTKASCTPLGIYAGDTLAGFLLYEPRGNRTFSVHRIMVDAAHQRRGIGRRAMEQIVERIRREGGLTIYLSHRPGNEGARRLFAGLGFVRHEVEPDGEILLRLGPPREIDS